MKPMVAGGVQLAVCTLGAQGAVASDVQESWLALAPPVQARNPIGAGDVMLAGLVDALRQAAPLPEALSWATALAAASVQGYEPGSVDLAMAHKLLSQVEISRIGPNH